MIVKKFNELNENTEYINSYELDASVIKECLPYLKKVNSLIPRTSLMEWFNENDIDYFNMTDLEMYIYFIENN